MHCWLDIRIVCLCLILYSYPLEAADRDGLAPMSLDPLGIANDGYTAETPKVLLHSRMHIGVSALPWSLVS